MGNIVSRNAIIKRIHRKLAKEGKVLRTFRSRRGRMEYGEFYITSAATGVFLCGYDDLEELERDIGVLREGEALDEG